MAFDNVRLPIDVERGAQGGPVFSTTVLQLVSGHGKRNQNWSQTRGQWDVGYGIQHKEDMQAVIDFFYARRGKARGFRFRDWSDYELDGQQIGIGDAAETEFQIFKRYSSGGVDFDRILTAVVADTLEVRLAGVLTAAYTLDALTGLVTFNAPPGLSVSITATCEFDVPVRFDTDQLQINMATFEAGTMPNISIVELKQGAL
jgi:uncharacterized protein (TIGR02217 family)